MQTDYLTQNPQVLSQRIHFSYASETSSHSIFSISLSGLLPLFPPCYLLTEISFQGREKGNGRDGAPVQTGQPTTAVPQRQKVGQWWSRFCFSSLFPFMRGPTLPLTSLLTFPVTKEPSFLVCFRLYLPFKIEKMLWLCVPLSSKEGAQAKRSDRKIPPVSCSTTPTGSSHTKGLNLLQPLPIVKTKPESLVIVSYSLAVMCWPQRLTQQKNKRGGGQLW